MKNKERSWEKEFNKFYELNFKQEEVHNEVLYEELKNLFRFTIQAEKEKLLDQIIADFKFPLETDPHPSGLASQIWQEIIKALEGYRSELGEKK